VPDTILLSSPDALVLVAQRGAVRMLTLNRPAALNSFTQDMHAELRAALDHIAVNPQVRAVVITGAGRGFCAGQDLNDPGMAPGADGKPEIGAVIEAHYRPLAMRLQALPVPVVCAVNGVAAGAGANFALCCDIVLAARSASFIQAFSKIGLIPDCGGTWLLPRLVGRSRALALALTGDKLSAADAERFGLIWQAVDDADLATHAARVRCIAVADAGRDAGARGARAGRAGPRARLHRRRGRVHAEASRGVQGPLMSDAQALAERVRDHMWATDRASQGMGMRVAAIGPGSCTMTMTVREDMLNGYGSCQGGLLSALADSFFAFACNAYNEITVASGFNVEIVAPGRLGDVLTATAIEVSKSGRMGVYDVDVRNQCGERVVAFRGRSCTMKGKPVLADQD
jgi:2-(1,2-epoxy-1,2-dihydrophenyl)acetyl-CoA isomerase